VAAKAHRLIFGLVRGTLDPNHFPARPVAPVGSPAVAGAGAADGRHGGRSIALSIFLGSLSLLALALALSVLLVVYRLTLAGSSATSGLGASLQTAGQAVTGSVQTAVQSVQDATDPFHPPRYAIRQDPEFDELRTVGAGGSLGTSSTDRFTVVRIVQRPEAGLPDQRVYALVHQQLIVPKVTKLLGITIHTDDGAKEVLPHFLGLGLLSP
jgi:hypothetical protein